MRRVHALIDLGDLLRIVRLALRCDGLEQTSPYDLVDLLVRDGLDVSPEALEALL